MNQQNIETNMKTLANHFDFTEDEELVKKSVKKVVETDSEDEELVKKSVKKVVETDSEDEELVKKSVKKVVESESEDEEPVKKPVKKVVESDYVYPIKYNSDHKQYTNDIIKRYLENIRKCSNMFFQIINATKLFEFILSELEFIKSDEFCSVENSKYNFIITTYKKCIEFKKTKYEPKSENEKIIYDEFQQIVNKLFEELKKIPIPLGNIEELLNK
jgi:hypothetical protein